mmetsp:Transcript_17552/g.34520  ORF Transcript_17552/g.34520 Transcript_17552/m.34520 type:complete len:392 (-) Transcript_17552:397-1572(-)|eukprot:CAMPEP_0171496584 /NCGR_PEP_ID=MMETSP0958-20121227/6788_1 /TAXON_ID=87120 /ORGANISM="Aurantiochytrium limacinum, Strain ATCCMYA-1381" /LENGTH=391 /DNA_ID=CAMNT_0012030713 /DNA_START=484 /DNA_END=1659 /DNA_ORIENTATION=+
MKRNLSLSGANFAADGQQRVGHGYSTDPRYRHDQNQLHVPSQQQYLGSQQGRHNAYGQGLPGQQQQMQQQVQQQMQQLQLHQSSQQPQQQQQQGGFHNSSGQQRGSDLHAGNFRPNIGNGSQGDQPTPQPMSQGMSQGADQLEKRLREQRQSSSSMFTPQLLAAFQSSGSSGLNTLQTMLASPSPSPASPPPASGMNVSGSGGNVPAQDRPSSNNSASLNTARITDRQTYKEVRERMVDMVDDKQVLSKHDFDQLYVDLRRTQEFARQVSMPDRSKLQLKDTGNINVEEAWQQLLERSLIAENDDENFIRLLIWRQHLRLHTSNFEPPTFADSRQWTGMLFRQTLMNMVEETRIFKNSKPRTRSELFLRLYLLAKVSGIQLEFHHTDFRSG